MRNLVFLLTGFIGVQSSAQVALTPPSPAISPPTPSFVPGSPALTPPVANTGLSTTNATLAALSESITVLQTNIAQALPILINFNDSFDFVSLAGTGTAGTTGNPPGNFGVNTGAVPTAPPFFNTRANATAQVPPGISQGVPTVPVTRDVLRALLVLQSDMQRMLPVLNALNGGSTNLPGGFSALFGGPATSP